MVGQPLLLLLTSYHCLQPSQPQQQIKQFPQQTTVNHRSLESTEYSSYYARKGYTEIRLKNLTVSVISIIRWGATYDKMYGGLNVIQLGASKLKDLNGIENGEKMFVVFNQRMLIAVLDSARVFDPGGQ